MKNEDKDFFKCLGVRSDVLSHSSIKNDDKQVIGHITMLDIEKNDLMSIKKLCDNMFDVAFVLKSSRDSYHLYNPVIRSFEDTHDLMQSIALEDDNHVNIGYKRGDWVLRISDKPRDGKIFPRPVYSHVYPNKRKSFSYPHLRFLHDYMNVREAGKVLKSMPTDGKNLEAVQYWTYK